MKKRHNSQFKTDTVKEYLLNIKTKSINQFAKEMNIARSTLGVWIRDYLESKENNEMKKIDMNNTPRTYKNKFYQAEFKLTAVRNYLLKKDNQSMTNICKELEIARPTLQHWVKLYGTDGQKNLYGTDVPKNLDLGKSELSYSPSSILISEYGTILDTEDKEVPKVKTELELIQQAVEQLREELAILEKALPIILRTIF